MEQSTEVDHRYLTFRLGDKGFAMPIQYVTEIVGMQAVTAVPDTAPWVRGIINLRGKIIPVMDMRLRIGLPTVDYGERTCIIVSRMDRIVVGMIVDVVREVRDIPPEAIQTTLDDDLDFMAGIGRVENDVEIILNASALLAEPMGTRFDEASA